LLEKHARLALLTLVVAACGGSSSTSPSSSSGATVATNTITITAAGVSPKNVEIAAGTRVLFINHDSQSHNMASDPHPEHDLCPEINQVGFLSPGESRETGNFVNAGTCGFHDHDNFSVQSLQGQIVIR
jgi:plastocyanin